MQTNLGPLVAAYRGLYRGMAGIAVGMLRRHAPDAIETVYLRGSAADAPVPGISDVDLFFVLRDDVDPIRHEAFKQAYRRLARACPVLDGAPWILRHADVATLFRSNPSLRFRVLETHASALRVLGPDALGGLPKPSEEELALALLFDLKTRFAYFSGFCLAEGLDDALEARRREHLRYKLSLDLTRAVLFLSDREVVFQRDALAGRLAESGFRSAAGLDPSEHREIATFVAHSRRFRLRRRFARNQAADNHLSGVLLRWALDLTQRFYAVPGLRTSELLREEADHVYHGDVFVPTGRPVVELPETLLADFPALRTEVRRATAGKRDGVLSYDSLRVNLSNVDPSIGHCSVVDRTLSATPSRAIC